VEATVIISLLEMTLNGSSPQRTALPQVRLEAQASTYAGAPFVLSDILASLVERRLAARHSWWLLSIKKVRQKDVTWLKRNG
jgi:hypothetical protein